MKSEIILPVPELKTALSGLNKIVGKRTTLPVLSCVKVSRQKNGLVSLQATDLDAHATFTLNDNQPGEVVDVLVPLDQLNKAFKCSTGSKQHVAPVGGGTGHMVYAANSFAFPLKQSIIVPDSKFLSGGGLLDNEPCFLAVQPGKK